MKKKVHILPHSHWDREWYFTTSRSKVYLMKDLHDVIENLENNPGYNRFIVDGQASLIEDYLKWRPQDTKRVQQLVQDHKLIIGPWYTQTDQFVISGESIVRNLLCGMEISKQFGDYMNVGYVPDSFGQESSMPQIYQQFGISDTMFWRGVSDEEVKHTEYTWKGLDGSRVNVYQIPCGYYIGGIIDETKLDQIMQEEPFNGIVKRSSTSNVAFPNGFDQAPVRTNLPQIVDKLNELNQDFDFTISSIEEYIAAVKAEHPELEEISGELTNGKNMRIHKSIYSSRSDLKKLNTQLQNYLVNVVEPVLTMGEQFGIEYPKETISDLWKLMFENAAHDSIGSCVSDTTNEDVYLRYKQVRDVTTNLVEITLRQIAVRIKKAKDTPITLTVFNPLPINRTTVVEKEFYVPSDSFKIVDDKNNPIDCSIESIEDQTDYILGQTIQLDPSKKIYRPEHVYKVKACLFVPDVPATGYKQLYLDLENDQVDTLTNNFGKEIENQFYKISVNNDGSLDILDKSSNKLYKNQGILVDNGDDGDSFNYSPAKKDLLVFSTDQKNSIQIQKSTTVEIAQIHFDFEVPKTLDDRADQKLNTKMPVDLVIKLYKGGKIIDFKLKIDNRYVDDHRLCIDFDTKIASKVSFADIQFGTIQRPVYRTKEMQRWEKEQDQWNEKPITIETCQSFVALANQQETFAVLPKGVREYEIIGTNYSTIRLTIFRTYAMMGKEDLLYRPGRASGEKVIATPNAELHKEDLEFEFGVGIISSSFSESNVAQLAKEYNTELQVYEYAEFLNGRLIFSLEEVKRDLPQSSSFLTASGDLIVSTIKKASRRSGYIVRLYNANPDKKISEKITFEQKPSCVELVDLKEDSIKSLPIDNQSVQIENVEPAKIVTVYFE